MSKKGYGWKKEGIEYCQETGKPCYDKRTAVTAKNDRRKKARVFLRVYQCPECNWWHLTSFRARKLKRNLDWRRRK